MNCQIKLIVYTVTGTTQLLVMCYQHVWAYLGHYQRVQCTRSGTVIGLHIQLWK